MARLLASLAVLIVLVAVFFVQRDAEDEMAAGLSREPIAPEVENAHVPTELDPVGENATAVAKTFVAAPAREPETTRTDATGRIRWNLIANVRGFTPLVENPVILTVSALGEDAQLLLKVPGEGRHEFDVTTISREQSFDSPSLNVLVDHPEFFLWDEVIDGSVENGAATFEVDIVLDPFRAGLSGRVTTPAGHTESVSVGVFQLDADTGLPDRSPIVLDACAEDGSFDIRVEDPGECFLVAHSARLRPETLRLTALPGTMREGLVLSLDRGSSITGRVTIEGVPLTENSSIIARAVDEETEHAVVISSERFRLSRNSTWQLGDHRLRFDEEKEHFENQEVIAFAKAGGAFAISGLEKMEYDIALSPMRESDRTGFAMEIEGGRFRAPAHGVRIDHRTVEVRLEFRRGGEIVEGVSFGVRYSSGLNRVSVARVDLATARPIDTIRLPAGRKTTLFIWGDGNNPPRDFEVDPSKADANGVVVIELPEEDDE